MAPDVALSSREKALKFLHDFLVGEFGLITMALAYGFAIVLPIVTTFFIFFSILEDSGYLSRLAVMVNRDLPDHGPQRESRPPDGARFGLRHDGHHDHPDP